VPQTCPSPLEVMALLAIELEELDTKEKVTRDLLSRRPDLFHEVLPAIPTSAPGEPRVGEPLKRAEAAA
jgi:hypothetical protein